MGAFFYELVQVGIYKRNQGRITRQVTFAAIAVVIALGLLRLSGLLIATTMMADMAAWCAERPWCLPLYWLVSPCAWLAGLPGFYLWFPMLLLALFLWASYRLVNVPGVADFLIAVEAEMNKVSWPTWAELFRSSMVVLILIFALGIILACYDVVWKVLLSWGLGIL